MNLCDTCKHDGSCGCQEAAYDLRLTVEECMEFESIDDEEE